MRKNMRIALVVAMTLVFGFTADANTNRYFSAASCIGATSTDAAKMDYSGAWATNAGSSDANVWCPILGWNNDVMGTIPDLEVTYYDASNTENIHCIWEGQTWNGSSFLSSYRHSCTTGGGCSNSTGDVSYVSTTMDYLDYVNNISGGTGQVISLEAFCTLPPGSALIATQITTTNP
jgi:hypothetical protein